VADPLAGGLALLGVVVGQAGAAQVGAIGGGDLPQQVEVAVPGGEFVESHHRGITVLTLRTQTLASATANDRYQFVTCVQEV
jgi:hypothetical protein